MASVPLTFVPPSDPGIVRLHIYESNVPTSGFSEIDSTPVGAYPNYITRYETQNAISPIDWFAIQWEDAGGARSELSAPIKGGTTTLVGDLVNRVMLRSPDLIEQIVVQEVEATISFVYRVDNPYSIDRSIVSRLWLTELANLALVAALYVTTVEKGATVQDYTAGLISERTSVDTRSVIENLERLERRSLKRLGIGGSLIASIQDSPLVSSITGIKTSFDSSRLLSARAIITEEFIERDTVTGRVLNP